MSYQNNTDLVAEDYAYDYIPVSMDTWVFLKIILHVVQPFWYIWTEYKSWVELTLCFYPKSYLQFTPKSCCHSINCHVCFPGRSRLASSKVNAAAAAAAAKSLQSCPTQCNPRDGCPPGSPVPGILQARTLEWISISFSNA